jgi:ABC-type glycerol-3-phosphate transport system substrate-binding protein
VATTNEIVNTGREGARMKIVGLLIVVSLLAPGGTFAQSGQEPKAVKVYVQGDSSRLADFVEECKREFANHKLNLQLVSSDGEFQYNVVIAQESSLGGAAAAAVALDRKGIFVASVVRSGRMSGKGALNAIAKELAKKLAILASQ